MMTDWIIYGFTGYFALLVLLFSLKSLFFSNPDTLN